MSDYREIPLTRGRVALVDAEDFERVNAYKWYASAKPGEEHYARRDVRLTPGRNGQKMHFLLHREIIGAKVGEHVDHINGNTLDNRKANLRIATPRQNSANVTRSVQQKRGEFKGVFRHKRSPKWQVSVKTDELSPNGKRKSRYIGMYTDPVEAALVYDFHARRVFGEFAVPNFPTLDAAIVAALQVQARKRPNTLIRAIVDSLSKWTPHRTAKPCPTYLLGALARAR